MRFFNIPSQCVFNQEVALNILLDQIGNANASIYSLVSSNIESVHIYACLKDTTYPIGCLKQKDTYLNEILFLNVKVNDFISVMQISKYILKIIQYQTVIAYQNGDNYCLAAGLVRDAKKDASKRTVDQIHVSPWLSGDDLKNYGLLNVISMAGVNYEVIYQAILYAIKGLSEERYISYAFMRSLYAYTHYMDMDDYRLVSELTDVIIQLCYDSHKKLNPKEKFSRFSEDEVYDIISYKCSCHIGNNLIETLYNFCEYENDFNLKIPNELRLRIKNYKEALYDNFINNIDKEFPIEDYLVVQDDNEDNASF